MIVPVTSEEKWIESISSVPLWLGPNRTVIVVVPHPDDEVLGVGGLICDSRRRGFKVLVIAVTDGEKAYPHVTGLAPVRAAEQAAALACLNVPEDCIVRLQLPDGDVASCESKLIESLLLVVTREVTLLAPWSNDYHPDHEACGRAAKKVAELTGAHLWSYLFWAWHFKTVGDLDDVALCRFMLDQSLIQAKTNAMACHQSQLSWPGEAPILYEPLLKPFRRSFEAFILQ